MRRCVRAFPPYQGFIDNIYNQTGRKLDQFGGCIKRYVLKSQYRATTQLCYESRSCQPGMKMITRSQEADFADIADWTQTCNLLREVVTKYVLIIENCKTQRLAYGKRCHIHSKIDELLSCPNQFGKLAHNFTDYKSKRMYIIALFGKNCNVKGQSC